VKTVLFVSAALVAAWACSCGSTEEAPAADEAVTRLAMTDSIGIEMGDSNYVFGSIMSIEYGPDGMIYVLDRAACCVLVYDAGGRFVRRIGSRGNGPGELMNPFSMAVLGDGRITICSPFNGGMHIYGPDGTWAGLSAEMTNNPPLLMEGADSNAYVALKLDVAPDEAGGLTFTSRICRYEESAEPAVVYVEESFPFDPADLTGLLRASYLGYCFGASRDGLVAIARRTPSSGDVEVYSSDGSLLTTLSRPVEEVAKSEDEILDEKAYIEALLQSMGTNGVIIDYDPDPLRDQVCGVGFDSAGRVWVQRGTTTVPVFDVWSPEGEMLFTAACDSTIEDGLYWEVEFGDGTGCAYSMNPDAFQQVYVFPLP
jgi:hypothetical protein